MFQGLGRVSGCLGEGVRGEDGVASVCWPERPAAVKRSHATTNERALAGVGQSRGGMGGSAGAGC